MKITIKEKSRNKGMVFHLPLFLMKAKFISKAILKYSKNSLSSDDELNKLHIKIKQSYKQLKHYIRKHGHFNVVEVFENNGYTVIIRV